MIHRFAKFGLILFVFVILMIASGLKAEVEINLKNTLQTYAAPLDVSVSADGRTTFVLTDEGNVLVYDHLGNLTETIDVGSHIDHIEIDPGGEHLFAASRKNKTVEIIQLSFIKHINTAESMFKGPENAPVTIAVFSEFQ